MNIFFWFLILAIITLMINCAIMFSMHSRGQYRSRPIVLVLVAGYVLAAFLYVLAQAQGTRIQSRTLACTMPIDTASTEEADGVVSYSLRSSEGIAFQFDESELLETPAPLEPSTLEMYYCQTYTGFSWCYLSRGTDVRYILK
jgi:hypothetical protein